MSVFDTSIHKFGQVYIEVSAYKHVDTGDTLYKYRMNYNNLSYSGSGHESEVQAYAAALTIAIKEVATLLSELVEEMEGI